MEDRMRKVKLLNRRQVAELLAVSERTVRRLVEKGDLPAPVRIRRAVRWHEAGVVDYIRRLPQGSVKPA
jgi:excisionase family DNA binding protein